jgi:hypothetical protein
MIAVGLKIRCHSTDFFVYLQICESWFQEVCDLFIVDFQK